VAQAATVETADEAATAGPAKASAAPEAPASLAA
jgi:hypothetical protein